MTDRLEPACVTRPDPVVSSASGTLSCAAAAATNNCRAAAPTRRIGSQLPGVAVLPPALCPPYFAGSMIRRLVAWTRSQFEPGVPDPYPPLDARIILRDIRSGFTGGFCAQYNYVLAQSLMSLGIPARYVTVVDHEVIEAWLRDERRWICADPLHSATYVDESGRTLSVLDLHSRHREGSPILPGPGSLPGTAREVERAFGELSVWLRNDHVSRPINFTDIDRYKVAFVADRDGAPLPRGLWTDLPEDLYFDPALP